MKRVLPSLTNSAIPPTLSSIGTFGSTCDMQKTSSVSIPRFFKLCSPELLALAGEERVAADQDCARMQLDQGGEVGPDPTTVIRQKTVATGPHAARQFAG